MLKVNGLGAAYGDLQVLWDVSIYVEAGELVAIVGPNGAGKALSSTPFLDLFARRAAPLSSMARPFTRCAPRTESPWV